VDVTICVATFGDPTWQTLARSRAIPSAEAQGVPVVHVHGRTLHAARNAAVEQAQTEWVIHLDADDELTAGYVSAMVAGTADVRAPAVTYAHANLNNLTRPRVPKVAGHHHDCTAECLPDGNWLVVGALVRRQLVLDVGGWRDFPVYEDWDLWLRCYLAGATFEAIPRAVYKAHARPDSRNRAPSQEAKNATHRAIVAANLGVPA